MRTDLLPYLFRDWVSVSNYIFIFLFCLVYATRPDTFRRGSSDSYALLYALLLVATPPIGFTFRLFQDLNGVINTFFGNADKPTYNAWWHNISLWIALPIVVMLLIRSYLPARQKALVKKLLTAFIVFVFVFEVLQIQPFYLPQSILAAVGSLCILSSCLVYFYVIMIKDEYLSIDLLRLSSFWQVTFILFYTSLSYAGDISYSYLSEKNPEFAISIIWVAKISGVFQSLAFLMCFAAPTLKIKLENPPTYA